MEWDALPTLLLNGILTGYTVNVTEQETGYTFEENTTNTSIILESLHPDYVYECRVAALTVAVGPFSTVFAVQLLKAGMVNINASFRGLYTYIHTKKCITAPSGPPDNITAVALTSSQILITWDPPLQELRNGPILAYNFTVLDTATGFIITSSVISTTSTTVSSLRPFTVYSIAVSARTSVGFGPYDSIEVTTLEDCKSYMSINQI